jgi:ssDNA-specific exonuclease RecJ
MVSMNDRAYSTLYAARAIQGHCHYDTFYQRSIWCMVYKLFVQNCDFDLHRHVH